jgi:hypothetical protein
MMIIIIIIMGSHSFARPGQRDSSGSWEIRVNNP